ncbi:MAG: inorganic diphosphatase [Acidobacteriota bacterium]
MPARAGSKSRKRSVSPNAGSTLSELPAWDSSTGLLHVIVDTPKGSRIKFKYEAEKRSYIASHLFPAGTFFPFDFGSIPSTLASDGDPLDVLVLMEEPSFTGCLVSVWPVGVLEAEQTQDGKTNRNDRILGVADVSRVYRDLRDLDDAPDGLLKEIERFFVSYNEERGRRFEVIGRLGSDRASRLVAAGERRFRQKKKPRRKR